MPDTPAGGVPTCRRVHAISRGWTATEAEVDGERCAPIPHARGTCLGCGAAMVAKTGRVRAHWAHAAPRDWDPWWEAETDWHREWKGLFPQDWREVPQTAEDGELHRADVMTPAGLTLEFQHSALRDDELASREAFYPQLVWVLDGRSFKDSFEFYHPLPHPLSPIADDIVWKQAQPGLYGTQGGLFFRVSEFARDNGPPRSKREVTYGWIHSLQRIQGAVTAAHHGHYQYGWVRPRRAWLTNAAPVFIDFGNDLLWKLGIYDESGLRYCRVTSVERFVGAAEIADTVAALDDLIWPTRIFPPHEWSD